MKASYMRRHQAESKKARMRKVLERESDLETEAVCLRFSCSSTFVETVRREVKSKGDRDASSI